jgi:hypothetical protein
VTQIPDVSLPLLPPAALQLIPSELLPIQFGNFSAHELEVLVGLVSSATSGDSNDINVNVQPDQILVGFELFAEAINPHGCQRCENPESTGCTPQPTRPSAHSQVGSPSHILGRPTRVPSQ